MEAYGIVIFSINIQNIRRGAFMEKNIKLMYNPMLPKYVHGKYDNFLLMKFFPEKDFRDYFLSGKLYMRSHTDFAKQELGIGRDDISEGADLIVFPRNNETFPDIRFIQKDGEVYVQVVEYTEKPKDYRENQVFISYPASHQQRNIFCMYTLWYNSKENLLLNVDVDNMKNFGEYGIIITDQRKFFNRVGTAANKEESILKMNCGFVNYLEEQDLKNVMSMSPFSKPSEGFSYQNEFRFCADTDNTNVLELDTHTSFEDIAISVNLEEFAKSVSCINGQIKFRREISGIDSYC